MMPFNFRIHQWVRLLYPIDILVNSLHFDALVVNVEFMEQ